MGCCWPSIEVEEEQVNIDVSNSLDIVNEVVDFENDVTHETNDLSVIALEDSISNTVKQAEEHPLTTTKKKDTELSNTLNTLLEFNEYSVIVFLSQTVNTKRSGIKETLRFLKKFVDFLSQEEKVDLETIFKDLPACVLGDEEEKETIRVFTDIFSDLKRNTLQQSSSLSQDQLTRELTSLIGSDEETLLFCMKSLPPPIRFKIVMSQIILAKVLKPNVESRGQVIAYLFS